MKRNWGDLVTTSEYIALQEVKKALKQAEVETGKRTSSIKNLSWKEVFDKEYILPTED